MKKLIPLLLVLAILPGCSNTERENLSKTEAHPVSTPEPIYHHVESPDDTTLPTKTKERKSLVEERKESAQPKVGE